MSAIIKTDKLRFNLSTTFFKIGYERISSFSLSKFILDAEKKLSAEGILKEEFFLSIILILAVVEYTLLLYLIKLKAIKTHTVKDKIKYFQ